MRRFFLFLMTLVFMLLLQGNAKENYPKAYCIKKIDEKITVDGKLDENIYKKLSHMNIEYYPDGKKAKIKTNGYIFYDKEFLYISVYCEEPYIKKMKYSQRPRDGKIWEDDDIEIFIQKNDNNYYQFLINPGGSIGDLKFKNFI